MVAGICEQAKTAKAAKACHVAERNPLRRRGREPS
jgi:hypothetical protein